MAKKKMAKEKMAKKKIDAVDYIAAQADVRKLASEIDFTRYAKYGVNTKKDLKNYMKAYGKVELELRDGKLYVPFLAVPPDGVLLGDLEVYDHKKETQEVVLKYLEHSSRYGDYAPHQYLEKYSKRRKGGILYYVRTKSVCLRHGTGSLLKVAETPDGDGCHRAIVRRAGFKDIFVCWVARKGRTEYHAMGKSAAIAGLEKKLEKQRINAKLRAAERKANISIRRLMKKFGWCELGVNEFLSEVGLNRNIIDEKMPKEKFLSLFEKIDPTPKKFNCFGHEILELRNFVKSELRAQL